MCWTAAGPHTNQESMLPTTEVRWFMQGEIPRETEEWFSRVGGGPHHELARADHYLRLSHKPDLGIKLRDGNLLEHKLRIKVIGPRRFSDYIEGTVEVWVKFRTGPIPPEHAPDSWPPVDETFWFTVHKERRLYYMDVMDGDLAVVPKVQDGRSPVCEFELGRLLHGKKTWWTVALEVAGRDDSASELLAQVGSFFFGQKGAPRLNSDDSAAYPEWMQERVFEFRRPR